MKCVEDTIKYKNKALEFLSKQKFSKHFIFSK